MAKTDLGFLGLFEKPRPSAGANQEAFDRFTLGHFGMGMALGAARATWPGILIMAIGWEIIERPMKENIPALFPQATQDSLLNATVDAISMIAGWYVTRKLAKDAPNTTR